MQRSTVQHNCPVAFDGAEYLVARERYWRRCQFWHAARLACADEDQFRGAWHSIAAAVADQLAQEFPTL